MYSEQTKIGDSFGIVSVYVYRAVNHIGRCLLKISAGDMPSADVPESNSDTFAPGKQINVEVGYGDEENSIFKGLVTSHKLSIRDGNKSVLEVECRELTFPMTQGRKNKVFTSKKDSAIISEVISAYSALSASVDTTATEYNELVQYYCTDWDFVLSRADVNGLIITTDGSDVSIKAPVMTGTAVLKVTYGMDLITFDGELTADDQQAAVTAVGWDIAKQEVVTATGATPSLNDQGDVTQSKLATAAGGNDWVMQTEICAGTEDLQTWVDAQLLKSGLSRIQGSVKFYGNAAVIPGCLIELDGLGNRFNGTAFIGSVEHHIREGEWKTTAGMGLSYENVTERPDVMAPSASGLLPGIQGLHIGKVKKLDEDPAGENRIQVEIPILNSNDNKVWARLGNGWSSSGYGSFSVPDIGDEVVLGFFNNDPCHAVILGSLYSSKQQPPYSLTADNYIRGFVSKEGIKLTMDDEKKIITAETPGGNKIVISDDAKGMVWTDENNNKVQMSNSGITIHSAKDLTLKAQQNIIIEAGTAASIKAKTDLKSEAMNIESKAKIGLKMQGTATAEISASGQTTVKGAMVMIN